MKKNARQKNEDRLKRIWVLIGLVMLCAIVIYLCVFWRGVNRGCSGWWAKNRGADWIVVQMGYDGRPFRCWELHGVSVSNEPQSDGIYWEDENGNLVHLSGLYNRVQVANDSWDDGFAALGLTREECRRIAAGDRQPGDGDGPT